MHGVEGMKEGGRGKEGGGRGRKGREEEGERGREGERDKGGRRGEGEGGKEQMPQTFWLLSTTLSILVGPSGTTETVSTPLPGECFILRISCSRGTEPRPSIT